MKVGTGGGLILVAILVLAGITAIIFRDEKPKELMETMDSKELAVSEVTVDPDESAESLYRRAADFAVDGKFEAALPLYEKLLSMKSSFGAAEQVGPGTGFLHDYGNCLMGVGKHAEALENFRLIAEKYEVYRLSGGTPDPERLTVNHVQMVACLNILGRHSEANKELEEFDRLFADFHGDQRESLQRWRKKIGEVLSSK